MVSTTKIGSIVVIAGFGLGISASVAEKFASLGYKIAFLSRTQAKLDSAAANLSAAHNISAKGFAVDLADPQAVLAVLDVIRKELNGTIGILFWNPDGKIQSIFDLTADTLNSNVISWMILLPIAVLVTGAGLALENDVSARLARAASVAISMAAQRKAVHILHFALKEKGVYVGEVTVLDVVKGTRFDDDGTATLTPESIADQFAELEFKREV
ncbi:hypothetical protein HK100_004453, partial [Physocladia obscura]